MVVRVEINNIVKGLNTILPLANCHMVHFITHNMFDQIIPEPVRDDIMALDVNELNDIVLSHVSESKTFCENAPHLNDFLNKARKISLKDSTSCVTLDELSRTLGTEGLNNCGFQVPVFRNCMSTKKSHEVDIMSAIVAAIAKSKNCSHAIDVGGGKGYLSAVLSLKHQLKVLSIDSSPINSEGAAKQIPKVKKHWNVHQKKSMNSDIVDTDLEEAEKKNSRELSDLCKLATLLIKDDTSILDVIREHFPKDKCGPVILAGLHTCGNLAASSLRLFVNNTDYIKCLVNVGCCYHLLVEEFDTSPSWLEIKTKPDGIGFPMSAYLRDQGFVLGRNARMLAAQPPDRISHKGTLQTEGLFYRALLEVYLEKKMCSLDGLPHFKVGKLTRKCTNFIEYVHKSIERLGIDIQVDDMELQELYHSNLESRKKLHAFFLLRLAIAPVIEAIIMLDRLLYLQEQGVEEAYLTQLFDPVISPRCFAIVAFNKSSEAELKTTGL